MRNKYFPTVSAADVKEIIDVVNISKDYVIQIDESDIRNTLVDAGNAVVIEGRSSGEGKVAKALAEIDAKAHCLIAEKLYSANRIMIYIEYDPKDEIKVYEMNAVTDFLSRFNPAIDAIWGVSRSTIDGEDTLSVKLLAANIAVD